MICTLLVGPLKQIGLKRERENLIVFEESCFYCSHWGLQVADLSLRISCLNLSTGWSPIETTGRALEIQRLNFSHWKVLRDSRIERIARRDALSSSCLSSRSFSLRSLWGDLLGKESLATESLLRKGRPISLRSEARSLSGYSISGEVIEKPFETETAFLGMQGAGNMQTAAEERQTSGRCCRFKTVSLLGIHAGSFYKTLWDAQWYAHRETQTRNAFCFRLKFSHSTLVALNALVSAAKSALWTLWSQRHFDLDAFKLEFRS